VKNIGNKNRDVPRKKNAKNSMDLKNEAVAAAWVIAAINGGQILTPVKKPAIATALNDELSILIILHALKFGKFLTTPNKSKNSPVRIFIIAVTDSDIKGEKELPIIPVIAPTKIYPKALPPKKVNPCFNDAFSPCFFDTINGSRKGAQ